MKIIDLESHFYTEEYIKCLRNRKGIPREELMEKSIITWLAPNLSTPRSFEFENRLLDLGSGRLEAMDKAGIDIEVLSLAHPGCEQLEASEGTALARQINDRLSKVVNEHPDRFIGLAALAPQDPIGAAKELERSVKELGLKGAKINSHIISGYLDDKQYWPIFEKAESLGAPIYLHPSVPSPAILDGYVDYGMALCGPPLGFSAETALHAMRLINSGVFDKHAGLKIILGHLGEGLPFWLDRIDFFWLKTWVGSDKKTRIAQKPSYYVKTNFMVTTSGMAFLPAFLCSYMALGADRIAFAADHPFEDSRQVVQNMESIPICDADKEKIFHLNAERLFKIS